MTSHTAAAIHRRRPGLACFLLGVGAVWQSIKERSVYTPFALAVAWLQVDYDKKGTREEKGYIKKTWLKDAVLLLLLISLSESKCCCSTSTCVALFRGYCRSVSCVCKENAQQKAKDLIDALCSFYSSSSSSFISHHCMAMRKGEKVGSGWHCIASCASSKYSLKGAK